MKRRLTLFAVLLGAIALGPLPRCAAARSRTPPPVKLTYNGGPLVTNVRVATLFWGSSWSGSQLPGYFNDFFRTLFADGRYLANLTEYSVSGHKIGDGAFAGTATDSQQPPAKLQDAQIQAEIRAQIAAGHLPPPDQNTAYVIFTPPGVEVFDRYGENSVDDFYSYHDYAPGGDGFPYVVMAYDDSLGDAHLMTIFASHELSEVVTDPQVTVADSQVAWYDDYYGEVADIVATLYDDGRLEDSDYAAELDGTDGSVYYVQKFWSVKASGPVALEQ